MIRRRRRFRSEHPPIDPAIALPRGMSADVLPLLRCPRTRSPLHPTGDGSLIAEDGHRRYPVVEGVPVLIDGDRSLVDIRWALEGRELSSAHATPASGVRLLLERVLGRLPTRDHDIAASRNCRRLAQLLGVRAASGRRPRALILGETVRGAAGDELQGCVELEVVEADIAFGPHTNVVCDCHDLPFADGAFDAVVIRGVLDRMLDPQRVASEVHRVLASDGLVYSEAGFVRQVDAGAFDFNRFTHLGHRRLWRFFDEVDSGAKCGPGTALLWSTEYFLRALVGESRLLRAVAERAVVMAGFWLKYVDLLLAQRPGGFDAAAGTFFLGSRRTTPVPDRVIVAGFRGILPDGQRLPPPRPMSAADEAIRASRGIRIRRKEKAVTGP